MILRRHPAFARLWTANLLSSLGGWSFGIAMAAHAFMITGSAAVTGGLVVAATAPALAGTVGGVVADRFDRAVVLGVVSWLRVVALAALVPLGDRPWAWYAVVLFQAGAQQLFTPAEQALVADLVDTTDLPAATGANSVGTNVTRLVAPALGGALVGLIGFEATVVVVLGLLAGSALLLAGLRSGAGLGTSDRSRPGWLAGFGVVRRTPVVRAVTVLQVLDGAKEGAFTALFPVIVLGVIGAGPAFLGTASSAFAISAVAAGPLVATIVTRCGYRLPIALGASICGVLLVTLAAFPSRVTTVSTFLLSGFPFTVSWVAAGTWMLLATPTRERGRMVGSVGSLYAATTMLSAAATGALATQVGPLLVLGVAAVAQVLAGPVFWLMTRHASASGGNPSASGGNPSASGGSRLPSSTPPR